MTGKQKNVICHRLSASRQWLVACPAVNKNTWQISSRCFFAYSIKIAVPPTFSCGEDVNGCTAHQSNNDNVILFQLQRQCHFLFIVKHRVRQQIFDAIHFSTNHPSTRFRLISLPCYVLFDFFIHTK